MKKIPVTLFPLGAAMIIFIIFCFLPSGADLISETGDYNLGKIIGYAFVLCLLIDAIRYISRKQK